MSTSPDDSTVVVVKAKTERKVFRAPQIKSINKIPETILNDPKLKKLIEDLPSNYDFEIHKTVWRIQQLKAKRVALQMPEGLLMFALKICDIIEEFTKADTVIMGDVTYGACCVDDYTAKALGVDLLLHYGHSCLIPIDQTQGMRMLYIFVNINIDNLHLIDTIKFNFSTDTKLALVSTVQFISSLHAMTSRLRSDGYTILVPQIKPLSPGEVLGCTSPRIGKDEADALLYLGDGRFHLESIMISNPHLRAYRYDPYEKKITEEFYDHAVMKENRAKSMQRARQGTGPLGVILGTLGHQGSNTVLDHIQKRIKCSNRSFVSVLLSEIFPAKLDLFPQVSAWIQIACPRLSIDWGTCFNTPLLSSYEAMVMLGKTPMWTEVYPMDYYAKDSEGPWTPNHTPNPLAVSKCCGDCTKQTPS
uniref:2-(3-amino-3-carboxypropyl)histidine synthase subunit 1 n=1 Tax=Cacopsylla melanoneura TaxID=428564 RepID=A0A8D8YFN3_9HEMI